METLSISERQSLATQFMPLAHSAANLKKKKLKTVEHEELISAAYLGLVDASSRYNPERGNFSSYASWRIEGSIQDYLRSLGFGSKGSNSRGCQRMLSNMDFSAF